MSRALRLAVLIIAVCPVAAQAIELKTLFPAGVQRGQSVEVTAGGTFPVWPVQVWVDRPGLTVEPAKENGKLTIRVAADANVGVYWLRLYDPTGASGQRPFVVGTLAELQEKEPNDSPQQAQMLDTTLHVVNGQLTKADVDVFRVALKRGQSLVASLDALRLLGSPMDGVLQILTADGFVLVECDDEVDLDPRLNFIAPSDGNYLVRIFAFPAAGTSAIGLAGGADFIYRLTLTTEGFLDHVLPLALPGGKATDVTLQGWNIPDDAKTLQITPAAEQETVEIFHPRLAGFAMASVETNPVLIEREPNGRDQPQEILPPVTVTGRIDAAKDEDVFRFMLKKKERYTFRIDSRSLGYSMDPVLRLIDAEGKTIQEVDDTAGQRDAELNFTATTDGEYRLLVRDLNGQGGPRYLYRLRVAPTAPDFAITLAGDNFVLAADKPLEIPVTIDRRAGFKEDIAITAVGLPEGVLIEAVQSLAKDGTAKAVKLKITAGGKPVAGSFRIEGVAMTEGGKASHFARSPLTGFAVSTRELWVTEAVAVKK
jgi:hypothetical protein